MVTASVVTSHNNVIALAIIFLCNWDDGKKIISHLRILTTISTVRRPKTSSRSKRSYFCFTIIILYYICHPSDFTHARAHVGRDILYAEDNTRVRQITFFEHSDVRKKKKKNSPENSATDASDDSLLTYSAMSRKTLYRSVRLIVTTFVRRPRLISLFSVVVRSFI